TEVLLDRHESSGISGEERRQVVLRHALDEYTCLERAREGGEYLLIISEVGTFLLRLGIPAVGTRYLERVEAERNRAPRNTATTIQVICAQLEQLLDVRLVGGEVLHMLWICARPATS